MASLPLAVTSRIATGSPAAREDNSGTRTLSGIPDNSGGPGPQAVGPVWAAGRRRLLSFPSQVLEDQARGECQAWQ